MLSAVPLVLGAFELQEPIATGGIGAVWRAVHTTTRVGAAVKVLGEHAARDPVARHTLRAELRAAAGLDHPNIVYVYGTGEVSAAAAAASGGQLIAGTTWIAMEYAEGGTLRHRAGTMTWTAVREALLDVLAGLAHAHARGLVHGDVKPANLLVGGARPGVKIGDFGLARLIEGARAQAGGEGAWGSPSYMAPEQIVPDRGGVGPWSDLYSLGCTAWALLTGHPPFVGAPAPVLDQQLTAALPAFAPLTPVPEAVEPWLRRLLLKDPALRVRHAADAARLLARIADSSLAGPVRLSSMPRAAAPAEVTQALADAPLRRSPRPELPPGLRPDDATLPLQFPPRPVPPRPIPHSLAGAGLDLLALRTLPVIGRDAEQEFLWTRLREVYDRGEPRAVVIHGPSGVGTSRLGRWISEAAAELGVARPITAWYGSHSGPARGLRPAFRRALRLPGGTRELGAADVLAAAPALDEVDAAALAAWLSARAGTLSRAERLPLLRAVMGALAGAPPPTGEGRPLVFWIDSAHHGSLDALTLLRAVMPSRVPVLFVVTVTDELLAARSLEAGVLGELRESGAVEDLPVAPLGEEACRALLREQLGLDPEFAELVLRRTSGNPLFALQVLGDCVQRRQLETGPAGVRLRAGVGVELPADLERLWARRVEAAAEASPPEALHAVELLAVLGDPADQGEWEAACAELGLPPAAELVEVLEGEGLLKPAQGDRAWAFVHAMFREALERRAARGGRLEAAHRACARMLAARGDRGQSERIGRHLFAAGADRDSLGPLAAGLEDRVLARDVRPAAALLALREEALHRAGVPADDAQVGEQRFLTALLAQLRGEVDAAEAGLDALLADARVHGWPGVEARALWLRGRIARRRGEIPVACERLRGAAEAAALTGDRRTVARAHADLGDILLDLGQGAEAQAAFAAALPIFEALEDAPGVGEVHLGLALLAIRREQNDDAARHLDPALVAFQRAHNRVGQARALNLRGDLARFQGRTAAAAEDYREAMRLLEGVQSWMVAVPQVNLGILLVAERQWGAARAVLEPALALVEQHHAREVELCARAALLAAAFGLGDAALIARTRAALAAGLAEAPLLTPELRVLLAGAADAAAAQGQALDLPLPG